MHRLPFDISKTAVNAASQLTIGTLHGIRDLLGTGMKFTGEQFQSLAKLSLLEDTDMAIAINKAGEALLQAESSTTRGMALAITASREAFNTTLEALDLADEVTRRALFENIHVASVVGESFIGVTVSQLKPSYRLDGEDVTIEDIINDFKKSGRKKIVICVPGLFCDEDLWSDHENPDNPYDFEKIFEKHDRYPVKLRFNPGIHISENGRALLNLLSQLIQHQAFRELEQNHFDIIAYSQGGLILRSALYQSNLTESKLSENIRTALLIGSPDGGSYLEKFGFWVGLLLELSLIPNLQLLGQVSNRRSDAIKDLSHGVIRREDWEKKWHISRYFNELYFGELDDVDAYQLFSLISEEDDPLHSWLGDGVVETGSLMYLSERVYKKKSSPEKRVNFLAEQSHFQVLHNRESADLLDYILQQKLP